MKKNLLFLLKTFIGLLIPHKHACGKGKEIIILHDEDRKFYKPSHTFSGIGILLLFFFCFLFTTTKSFAQAFSETWALTASTAQTGNTGAVTTGNTELIGTGMTTPTYGTFQHFTKPGGNPWPTAVTFPDSIYVEFPVTPTAGNNLTITSITFTAYMNNGSGSPLTVNLYSGTAGTTATGITTTITSTGTPGQNITLTPSISVLNGTTQLIGFYITGGITRSLNLTNVVISGTSTSAFCANATLSVNTTVAAGNIGAGTTKNLLNSFSIGASTNLTITGISFPFTSSGLVAGDLTDYRLYYATTNTFASAALLSTVSTGLTTSPINFTGFTQAITSPNTGYFWVTADLPAGATIGHSITASALTPANITFTGSPTTCGSVAAQGTQTIIVYTLPTVTTTGASSITTSTATIGGNVTNDGGVTVTEKGLIYSTGAITDTTSTTGGGKILNATGGTGSYTASLTGLLPGTTYHVRSFAVNSLGVSYGADSTFTTPPPQIRSCGGTVLNGSAAKEGTFYLYAYVKAGEKIDWDVIRTLATSAGNWTINVFTPTGLYSTCTIGTTVGNQCSNAQIPITTATAGIWTLQAIPLGTNGDDIVCPGLNVFDSSGNVITGRVWTESLHGEDNSSGVEPDFTLYFLTPQGYEYSGTYSGLNGLNYTIVSDAYGVRTAANSCVSAYQSTSYTGATSPLGPDQSTCGTTDKIFFSPFDPGLPDSALRYNVAANGGQIMEPLINTPDTPVLSNPVYTRSVCASSSTVSFNVTGFTGTGYIYIDVNDNGSFTDPVDVIDTVNFVNGVNTFTFNGKDGLGNTIPVTQAMNVKVAISKLGETHFVMSDIEVLGSISVTRLNGPGAPSNTLYWNDSNLPTGNNCSFTPVVNGSGGVNSSGGVHGWTECGSCVPISALCGNTNSTSPPQDAGSWGNQRLIDNWAYITDSTLNHTIYVPPIADTTFQTACSNHLPFVWNGVNYSTAGTYSTTLTSSGGCDSVVILVLTVKAATSSTTNVSICPSAFPYSWNSNSYPIAGTYSVTLVNSVGCDSVATLILTQKATSTSTTNVSICPSAFPYSWNSNSYSIAGTYSVTLVNSVGCDSVATLILTKKAVSTSTTNVSICPSAFPYSWNSNSYPIAGTYSVTLVNSVGCDSVATLILTKKATSTSTTNISICPSAFPYSWNSNSYPIAGTYNVTLVNAVGCDSIATLILAQKAVSTSTTNISICPSAFPYSWNGNSYPIAGTYNVTLVNAVGCDSIATLVLAQNATSTSTTSISICPSAFPYSWSGNSYPIAGTYNVTLVNAVGCDSIATLILTQNAASTSTTSISICPSAFPYSWNGSSYPIAGTYSVTLVNAVGCDSIATLILTQNATSTSTTSISICPSAFPYTWNGSSYPIAGTYNVTLVNAVGCDSIATLVLMQKAVSTSTTNISICPSAFPYSWNGNSYPIAGTYNVTLVNAVGCDSIATLVLAQNAASTSTTNISICPSAFPYTWNGSSYPIAGTYNVTLVNAVGCDSVATLILTQKAASTSTTSISICPSAFPYTWNGNSYPIAGTYSVTLVNAVGCDSIATLVLAQNAASTSTTNISICPSAFPYTWNGNSYPIAGTYSVTLVNAVGCDSIATLVLAQKAVSTSTTNISICPSGFPYSWNGNSYPIAGTYNVTLVNSVGCDSVATLILAQKAASTSTTNISICPSAFPYSWNGNSYPIAGTYSVTLVNAVGCDSITTLVLTQNTVSTSTTSISICPSAFPYSWNGNSYPIAGTYNVTLTNSVGCDSIATLVLTQNAASTSTTNISICPSGFPYSWNGNSYPIAGTYNVTLVNSVGCDSVATLILAQKAASTSTTNISICPSAFPYSWNGNSYPIAGTYNVTLVNSVGCDSVATLILAQKAASTSTTNISICPSAFPYSWNGNSYPIAGTYNVTLVNSVGCDSVATLILAQKAASTSTTNISICPSAFPYSWNGNSYPIAGTYNVTLTNSVGCDSIATLVLTQNAASTSTTNISICPSGFPYSWNGNSYPIAGTYNVTLVNSVGCDSVATLILAQKAASTSTTNISICPSAFPYSWNGNSYPIAGTYNVTLVNSVGCDSVATLILAQKAVSTSTTDISICPSAFPYTWNGNSYPIAGTYNVTLVNAVGCDSIATLILTQNATSTSTTNISICPSAFPYSWNGNSYPIAGTYNVTLVNAVGCDSITTLVLTQNTVSTSTTSISICPSAFPYSWNGNSYPIAGTYNVTLVNAVGCDSIATLILTQNATSTSTTNISICPSAFPYSWNGNSYPIAGTYNVTLVNAVGCDSITTLVLTQNTVSTSTTSISICPSAFPYSWNGNSYPIAGTYNVTLTNSVGCDSIATLVLTQNAASTSTTNISICPSGFPYSWNGNSYPIAGTYNVTLVNSVGCDSVATLILAQKAASTSTTNISICPSAFPYSWNGNSYPIAGTYNVTLVNAVGCDSITTLVLTQNTVSTSTTSISICPSAFPYSWNGNSYPIAGTYSVTLVNAVGCDSITTLVLTQNTVSTSTTSISICPSAFPYSWNGNSYPIAGTYNVTLTNSVGCDSIATLVLTQNAASTSTTNISICPSGFPYSWNGNSYPIAGTYNVTLVNSVGCDSVATLILAQKAASTSTTNISICPSAFPYSWNGNSYPIAGTYNVTLVNSVGCDSVATLILAQKAASTSTTNISICPSAFPYSWNGNSYPIAGTYNVTLVNSVGCDSVATLILAQKAVSTSTTDISICPSAFPYTWNGNSYPIAGTYNVTLVNAVGCDSITTLVLTQNTVSTSTTSISICPSAFPYSWNGNSYPIAGTYNVTLTNSVGCDSIATLVLTQNAASTSTTNISICPSGFPYSWNGNSYPIAGTYNVTLVNSVGCDSVATLILAQKAASTSTTNISICPSAFPYSWNGNSYPIAGTYSVTLVNAVGCDSITTLVLTQNTVSTSTTSISICPSAFPYSWNGNSYPIAGTYNVTLTNSVGCDSIATLVLTQNAASTSTTNISICPSGFPYSWNGNSYPIAGTYNVTLVNAVGCDSIATLVLAQNAASTSTTSISICPSAFPYTWNGSSYPIAGTYNVTLVNAVGCDSIATLVLAQKAVSTSTTNISICPSAFPYSWNGSSYPIAGTYNVTLVNAVGCDSITTLVLTQNTVSTSTTSISICPSAFPYTWNGNSYPIAGAYNVTLVNAVGCDSIATLVLAQNAASTSTTSISICPSAFPYSWNGNSYPIAGTYNVTLVNAVGCDSIATLVLAQKAVSTSTTNISICPSAFPYTWNGNSYPIAGTYNVTLVNAVGCDSIATLVLAQKAVSTSTTNISICPSAFPYSWNSNSYATAGTYAVTLTNSVGCDSVATLILTQKAVSTSTTNISICPSAFPYSWNGNSYPIAGTYNVTLVNAVGCDSIATLVLAQNAASTSTTNISICPSAFPYSWNGNSYPIAGTYNVTLVNSVGCDSVATLILAQNAVSTSTTNISICPSAFPYSWNGNSYPIAGTYNVTLTNSVGCDSIATLVLTQNAASTSTTNISICPSAFPYSWNGNSYPIAGTYNVTLTNSVGCDSVATLILAQNAVSTSTTNISICPSAFPYTWNGNSYPIAGTYNVTLVNAVGCDSIATLVLTQNAASTSTTNISICPSAFPYSWNGNSYPIAGTYNVTLANAVGCDSIATLILTQNAASTSTTDISICPSTFPYTWNGNSYPIAGTYNVTLVNSVGCDSVATLILAQKAVSTSTTNISICPSAFPYNWNGNSYPIAGTYNVTLVNAVGCDSIATLVLAQNATSTSTTNISICPSAFPYSWNGNSYPIAGTYSVTLVNAVGCDSIATLILTQNAASTSTTSISICPSAFPYTWNGNSYPIAGTYNVTLVNAVGCDSIATLVLAQKAVSTSTTNISICPSAFPYSWNGSSYPIAGTYNVTLTNSVGCDSIATLVLAQNATSTSTTNISICPSAFPYSWNGNSYPIAGTYNVTLVNSAGCDSIATLILTQNATSTSTTNISICPSAFPYSWNGNSYPIAGTYNVTLVNAVGCDSIATLILTQNATSTSTTNISICPSAFPYSWNGNSYPIAGTYNVTLVNAVGCDSIATLILTQNATSTSTTNISICPSAFPYSWNGNSYPIAGTYSVTLVNAVGCDSVATLILNVFTNPVTNNLSLSNCSSVTFKGITYTSSTVAYDTIRSIGGCDSIHNIITISINPITTTTKNTAINNCSNITFKGIIYTSSATVRDTIRSIGGCDSIYNINTISINPIPTATNNTTLSNCSSITFKGVIYTSSATVRDTIKSIGGCDSIYNITTIAINPITPTTNNTQLSNCHSITFNGVTYSSSTVIRSTVSSIGGCDSIYNVATITINPIVPVTIHDTVAGCGNVVFNGVAYSAPTALETTMQSAGGCDSVYRVTNIIVNPDKFDLSLAASENDVKKGSIVNIVSDASTTYNVIAWQPAPLFPSQEALSQELIVDSTTHVQVTARSSAGCEATASLVVMVKGPDDFYVPNAFTPNDDGRNDYFRVYGTTIDHGLLRIYNQWGQLLFETTNITIGWDGNYNGVPQPVGVYAYTVVAVMDDGSQTTAHGFLNLIR